MKINVYFLIVSALGYVLSFTSCEDRETDISDAHMNDVAENVFLLEHSNSSITVAWDFIKGATSYTVQLLESADSDYPAYMYTTSTEDYYEFSNLGKRKSYYARVRANFPYSATSKWEYVMNGNQPARIIPAYGIVAEDYEMNYINCLTSTSSTLTIEWSFTDFQEADAETKNTYTLEVFNDEACSDLYISWENISGLFAPSTDASPKPLRFTFTGLEADKDHYIRVTDITNNEISNVVKLRTATAGPSTVSNPKNVGDIIIAQDFSKFIHGGDILYSAAGYTVGSAAGRAEWVKAIGKNPVNSTLGQATCNLTTEFNVFDGGNVLPAYTEGTGMKDWGKSGNTSTRPGYIKIGGSKAVGILYTPELSTLSANATVTITFKAAIYTETGVSYCEDIVVETVEGAQFSAKGAITNQASVTVSNTKIVPITDATGKFVEYTVTFPNVTPASRIAFSSNPAKTADNKTRFLLDDIVVKIGSN